MTKPGPGKFEANESQEIAEFLYSLAVDDEIGDTETFGWHGLITELDTLISKVKNFIDITEFGVEGLFDTEGTMIERLKPAYIVVEDNNGFYTYTGYDSNTDARKAWKKLTDQYLRFVSAEGVDVS